MRLNQTLENLQPFSYCGTGFPIHLDANENFLPVPKNIMEEIAEQIKSMDLTRYPDDRTIKLRSAIASAYNVQESLVAVGNGSDELISMLVGGLVPFGGNVVGFQRDFGSYWSNCAIYGRNAIKLPRNEDLSFSVDMLIKGAKENNADLVIFSNPNNPSGSQILREEVIRLIESLDCLVAIDEAYMDFADQSVIDLADKYPNVIVLRTLSKALGAAGLRVGFCVANQKLIYALNSVRDAYNISAIDQLAAVVMLSHPEYKEETINKTKEIMGYLAKRLEEILANANQKIIVYPTVTNFIMLKFEDTTKVNAALNAQGYSVRTFDKNYMRISAASKEVLDAVLDIISQQVI